MGAPLPPLPSGFALSATHRQQIEALAAGGAIHEIETAIDRYLAPAAPLPPALWVDCEALANIAALAERLGNALDALTDTMSERRLGTELAHWQPAEMVQAIEQGNYREYRARIAALAPAALAEHRGAVRRVGEAANVAATSLNRPVARGRPAARDGLIFDILDALDWAIEPDGADWWRDTWAPLTAPKGRLCRLLGICLEAAGDPRPANIAQMVKRALERKAARLTGL